MAATINTYLSFRDTAAQAMEFYQSVFGGELQSSTFAEYQVSEDPAEQSKIMHSMLTTPSGQVLMAADTPNSMEYSAPAGHSLSVSGDDETELRRYWEALSLSGSEIVPLALSPWGDSFGMCVDRFGITWMVNIAGGSSQDAAVAGSTPAPVDTAGDATGV
ncbi:VOC family protein [Arthrobacter sp. NamB2]|uniref:VOC family protein n=1 Tax=Arthrobacter sp. NamB2 TaxID=2576035 RepID=UPI0010C97A83|nr:VOC family protein [Arthrobacter sp. NamB2]TKV29845.1 VOC family protein [Arthrobacter sp. NamB2]